LINNKYGMYVKKFDPPVPPLNVKGPRLPNNYGAEGVDDTSQFQGLLMWTSFTLSIY
jgi:hypothetical protein